MSQVSYFFGVHSVLDVPTRIKKWGFCKTAGLPDDFLVQDTPSFFDPFEPSAEVQMRWFRSKFIPELNTNTDLFPRTTKHIAPFFRP